MPSNAPINTITEDQLYLFGSLETQFETGILMSDPDNKEVPTWFMGNHRYFYRDSHPTQRGERDGPGCQGFAKAGSGYLPNGCYGFRKPLLRRTAPPRKALKTVQGSIWTTGAERG